MVDWKIGHKLINETFNIFYPFCYPDINGSRELIETFEKRYHAAHLLGGFSNMSDRNIHKVPYFFLSI